MTNEQMFLCAHATVMQGNVTPLLEARDPYKLSLPDIAGRTMTISVDKFTFIGEKASTR